MISNLLARWFDRHAKNSLYFVGDLDDLEFLRAASQHFAITIEDAEAERLFSMGDLEAIILAKHHGGAEANGVWDDLCGIARDHSGHKGPIDRETSFFPAYANSRRTANG